MLHPRMTAKGDGRCRLATAADLHRPRAGARLLFCDFGRSAVLGIAKASRNPSAGVQDAQGGKGKERVVSGISWLGIVSVAGCRC